MTESFLSVFGKAKDMNKVSENACFSRLKSYETQMRNILTDLTDGEPYTTRNDFLVSMGWLAAYEAATGCSSHSSPVLKASQRIIDLGRAIKSKRPVYVPGW